MSIVLENINPNLLKVISEIANKENKTETEVLEKIIKKGIKKEKKRDKIPDYLIVNKDSYDPDPESVMKMAGIVKGCEPFNAVELIRKTRMEN